MKEAHTLTKITVSRSCYSVAATYVQLSRDLFNAAFVSCWSELNESLQDDLLQSLRQALTSQDIPEITQTLLNLAEFMEHCDKVCIPAQVDLVSYFTNSTVNNHYKRNELSLGQLLPSEMVLLPIQSGFYYLYQVP